jgi:hypothetical protein
MPEGLQKTGSPHKEGFGREAGRARRERLDQRLRPVYRGTDGYLVTWG